MVTNSTHLFSGCILVHEGTFSLKWMSLLKTVSRVIRVDGLPAVGEAGQIVHETFQALTGFCQIGLCAPQTKQSKCVWGQSRKCGWQHCYGFFKNSEIVAVLLMLKWFHNFRGLVLVREISTTMVAYWLTSRPVCFDFILMAIFTLFKLVRNITQRYNVKKRRSSSRLHILPDFLFVKSNFTQKVK